MNTGRIGILGSIVHHFKARRRLIATGLAGFGIALLPAPLLAADPVILTVTGRVSTSKSFTKSDLEALGVRSVTTSTAWTDGPHVFEGVLARDVLAAAGATSSPTVTASAINDYSIDIPLSDFTTYDVIFAWSMDGTPLTRRDKGPLWIVYPQDDVAELMDELYESRWVWQLDRLLLP